MSEELNYGALLVEQLPFIRRAVRSACYRYGLCGEADDVLSALLLKLIDRDYATLRQYAGMGELRHFLSAVIVRFILDYQNAIWGKWRPSAQARKQGSAAVYFERLTTRDGLTAAEAAKVVADRFGLAVDRLISIQRALPVRPAHDRRRKQSIYTAQELRGTASASIGSAARTRNATEIQSALKMALAGLTRDERQLLRLRFAECRTVASIASDLGTDAKGLYRRYDQILLKLKRKLEAAGTTGDAIRDVIGRADVMIRSVLHLPSSMVATGERHTQTRGPLPDVA